MTTFHKQMDWRFWRNWGLAFLGFPLGGLAVLQRWAEWLIPHPLSPAPNMRAGDRGSHTQRVPGGDGGAGRSMAQ